MRTLFGHGTPRQMAAAAAAALIVTVRFVLGCLVGLAAFLAGTLLPIPLGDGVAAGAAA
jgi:hypothetical protein